MVNGKTNWVGVFCFSLCSWVLYLFNYILCIFIHFRKWLSILNLLLMHSWKMSQHTVFSTTHKKHRNMYHAEKTKQILAYTKPVLALSATLSMHIKYLVSVQPTTMSSSVSHPGFHRVPWKLVSTQLRNDAWQNSQQVRIGNSAREEL